MLIWCRFWSMICRRPKSTWVWPKWTSDQHTIDKKQQKLWNFMSTWYRHRILCRIDVDINIHDFCRFWWMLSICDVDFCRMYVVHMSTTYDRPKRTSDQHTIDKKRQKSWILMSTSCRLKNLCRYHVDMKFHVFCRFLSIVC